MKKLILTVISLFLVMPISDIICFADDAAMVIDLKKGGAAHYESGKKKGSKVMLADFLNPGDNIRLEPDTLLILNYFDSGVVEKVRGPGTITIGKKCSGKTGKVNIRSSKPGYIPRKALLGSGDTQQTAAAKFRSFKSEGSKIRISGSETTYLRPGKPITFRWTPIKGAADYEINLRDSLNKGFFETKTSENVFSYDTSNLEPYELYICKISAQVDEKEFSGERSFGILDKETLHKVITAEKKIRAGYPKDSDGLLFRLAIIYRYYELNDEADEMLEKLR